MVGRVEQCEICSKHAYFYHNEISICTWCHDTHSDALKMYYKDGVDEPYAGLDIKKFIAELEPEDK